MAYQLGTKPLPKPMMTLPEGANLCGISINFWTVCTAVSMILMAYPVISKHFRYFFQFLQIQVEESSRNLFFPWSHFDFELVNKNTTAKYLYSVPFYDCFTYSSIFKLFHIFSSFFRFRWMKPISSRKPSQFPSSNEHVNSNTTVKYWYSAHFCCCFISLENYNFLHGKILHIYPFQTFWNFYPSFFHFKWKKDISSRKPSQLWVSLPMEGTCKQQ